MNRRALLDALARATFDIPQLKDVIAPFGFEVSPEFVPERIRPQRLYLYAVGQPGAPEVVVSTQLADWIFAHRELFTDPLGRDLAYITANSRKSVNVIREEGLGIHIYVVPPELPDNLLLAYSHYVALIPLAINKGVLRELVQFNERPSCRRYVFQFSRMFPFIHGIKFSIEEEDALRCAADANGSRMPGNPLRIESFATEDDQKVLNTVVLPACNSIARSLANDASDIRWIDFHNGSEQFLAANHHDITARARGIAEAYRTWGLVER